MDIFSIEEWPLALRTFHDGIGEIGCASCDTTLLTLDEYSSVGTGFTLAWLAAQVSAHRETCARPPERSAD